MSRRSIVLGSTLALLPALLGACNSPSRDLDEIDARSNPDALRGADKANSQQPSLAGKGSRPVATDGGVPANPGDAAGAGAALCGNALCQCNNGVDDDGDGSIDGADVECVGALDDDERTFATGIPGDNKDPKWQDCFFDGNSGHGDDRCRYPTGCLTGELATDDPACAITQACLDGCFPSTPSGCDCFGCCTVQVKGREPVDIRLTESCTAAALGDPELCPVCTKTSECQNDTPPEPEPEEPGDPTDPEPPPPPPETPPPPPEPEDPGDPVIR